MGLRSAFNPLGALPYAVTVSYSTVSWKVDGLTSGLHPSSWKLWNGASTFVTVSNSNSGLTVTASESTVNGALVVTFSCDIPNGWNEVTDVTLNDGNFVES